MIARRRCHGAGTPNPVRWRRWHRSRSPQASPRSPAGRSRRNERRSTRSRPSRSRRAKAGKRSSRRAGVGRSLGCSTARVAPARHRRARRATSGSSRSASPSTATAIVSAVDHKPKSTTALARLADIEPHRPRDAARRPLRRRRLVGALVGAGRPAPPSVHDPDDPPHRDRASSGWATKYAQYRAHAAGGTGRTRSRSTSCDAGGKAHARESEHGLPHARPHRREGQPAVPRRHDVRRVGQPRPRRLASRSSTPRSTRASTSSTPRTSTPPVSPRRSSARRSPAAATTSCSRRRCTRRWARTRT